MEIDLNKSKRNDKKSMKSLHIFKNAIKGYSWRLCMLNKRQEGIFFAEKLKTFLENKRTEK